MDKCRSTTCSYKKHDNIANNGGLYCCLACKKDLSHGPACQKILLIKKNNNSCLSKLCMYDKNTNAVFGNYCCFECKTDGGVSHGTKCENISDKYTFINIPKTGSCSLTKYIETYYRSLFNINDGFTKKCKINNNPIIVLRDPVSRFISMYNYWKSGGDLTYKNKIGFTEKYKRYTIKDYINLLKVNAPDLNIDYVSIWQHLDYSAWLNNIPHKYITVILYESNLQHKLEILFKTLNIPIIKETLSNLNVSVINKTDLDEHDLDFIKTRYKYDYDLLEKAIHTPEVFKLVI